MHVESFVLGHVVANARQEDEIVEALGHFLVQIRRKDSSCLIHGCRRPTIWIGQIEHLKRRMRH